jgi:membrane-associated phospholipid phosphatase
MNLRLRHLIPVTLITLVCIRFVDRPVALLVRDHLYGNRQWRMLTSSLPDALLAVVATISLAAFIGYLHRSRRLLFDVHTRFLAEIALSLPLSYGIRWALKLVFGRVVTRLWITNPRLDQFHWFQGGAGYNGFPSGHMIVFATLFAAIARYLPRYRLSCYLLLLVLALLLVATNYHFVADVICGTYIGFLVEGGMAKLLCRSETGQSTGESAAVP